MSELSTVVCSDHVGDISLERENLIPFDLNARSMSDLEASPSVVGALVWHEAVDLNFLIRYPNLKVVVRYGVGFDNLDLTLLRARGVVAYNTPDYGVMEVSQTTLAMVLHFTRGISYGSHAVQSLRELAWSHKTLPSIHRSTHSSITIIGLGRIGSQLAKYLHELGFGLSIVDPNVSIEKIHEDFPKAKVFADLSQAISDADVVCLTASLEPNANPLITPATLKMMKPHAVLINTARGGLVESDEDILMALENNQIAGFGGDVLRGEPPLPNQLDRMEKLAAAGKLLVTPHTAYWSIEAYDQMRKTAAETLAMHLGGKPRKTFDISNR